MVLSMVLRENMQGTSGEREEEGRGGEKTGGKTGGEQG